jgi:5,10-methylenetetrahydromethanopterin reductase
MSAIEFGTTGFYPAFDGAVRAKRSEEMGFDIQCFSENHSRATDCFGEMRDALRETSRIKLAAGPVNFVTRNPGVVAAAVVPLQVLSKGRVICNVAAGDSAVAAVGLKPQRIADMERDIGYLRTYLERGEVQFGEYAARLEWADALSFDPIPVQMVCSGPKSIALAARRADRICFGIGCNNERVRWALDIVEEEAARRGRNRDDIRIGLFAPLALTADRTSGRAAIRTRVAAYAHMQSGRGVDLSLQPEILRKVTSVLRDGYDYRFHRPGVPAENPNTAVCDEEFGDWMGIGGPPSYVVNRLGELVEMGIDFFITALPTAEQETFAADVMPAVRKLRA